MSLPIIEVEGLSKSYQLGETVSHDTLRDAIAHGFRSIVGRGGGLNTARHKNSETLWALKDVSFNVNEGEVLGIIGRNGAGKSTLLKILSRITDPTSGTARIRGRVASLLEVGTGFHPELTGRENIYMNGAILGMTRREMKAKFDEIVTFAEVERFIDTPVKRYSSGMYVRLAFAVAAHIDPEILIVDEVLAVGDAQFQKKCLGKMQDVSKGGRTVLFVSHNMGAVQRLCPHSMLLDGGRLITSGNTDEVVDAYISGGSSENETAFGGSLEELHRDGELGRDIRISMGKVFNSKGRTTDKIMFGEPFKFYMEAISDRRMDGISFVIGIDSNDGNRITTIVSEDSEALYTILPGSPLRACAHFDGCLILNPGLYRIIAGIRRGSIGLDRILCPGRLEVMNLNYKGGRRTGDVWGVVHTSPKWEEKSPDGVDGWKASDGSY